MPKLPRVERRRGLSCSKLVSSYQALHPKIVKQVIEALESPGHG